MLLHAHHVGLYLRSLVAQDRGAFLAWSLVDEVRLVLVLLASPERQVAPVLVRVGRKAVLVVLLGGPVARLVDVGVNQLGEGTFGYQVGVLCLSLLLNVRLGLPHIGGLLFASVAFRVVLLCGRLVLGLLVHLLLIKDRVVDTLCAALHVDLLLEQALAARLLLLLLVQLCVAQHHLLLLQIARGLIDVASYEPSAASWNFHEVLSQLLFLCFGKNRLFLTDCRVGRIRSALLVLQPSWSSVPLVGVVVSWRVLLPLSCRLRAQLHCVSVAAL